MVSVQIEGQFSQPNKLDFECDFENAFVSQNHVNGYQQVSKVVISYQLLMKQLKSSEQASLL
jgi:hypothetical protein